VNKTARAMADPRVKDLIAAKRILRYLQGTKDKKITYSVKGNTELIGYCDADWRMDLEHRRSTTGYIFLLAGAAISWVSKKQPTVALSSTEAEYMASCAAAQETIYLRVLLKDLHQRTC